METWPNFFIVGAAKSGTTSLYEYLKQIPQVYMSPVKEPHYFSKSIVPDKHFLKPIRDKKKYLKLFEGVKNEIAIGEASPTYLPDPEAPKLIHDSVPNAHIIIILRDPIERAYSDYLMSLRLVNFERTFHDVIHKDLHDYGQQIHEKSVTQFSFYSESVKRYLDIFGQNQVKIIIFEEFIQDKKNTLQEILIFFGIDYIIKNLDYEARNVFSLPRNRVANYIYNSSKIRKAAETLFSVSTRRYLREKFIQKKMSKLKMSDEDKIFLKNLFHEDVQRLKIILGRPPPWPNFQN